ncbi:GNAT family N-acetyltransferase [Viridibacterium curvum]|uniref:BioF2-like acetyltransferase domain-containing protein n=1 Tax=Viridibacterium curvum TaxID=1101404 RepID=A0ABP9R1G0_9RHOO
MKLSVCRYDEQRDRADWESLCARAPMANLLHTRRFLSYHGERFEDQSLIARDEAGTLRAALPAARLPHQPDCVVSHPGASFGGVIQDGSLLGEDLLQLLSDMAKDLAAAGFRVLRYKAVPTIYQRWPVQDDLYALVRLGATLYRRDLSSCIAVDARREPSARRQRSLRKARNAGVTVRQDMTSLEAFWAVLCETLRSRHGTQPVHTLDEIRLLAARFPDDILLVVAELAGQVEAGVLLFNSPAVSHAQYIASSETGNACCALDAVFEHCIAQTGSTGRRYFDFGISNEEEGRRLNTGLYRFKSEFGGGGATHDFYELALD